MILGYLIPEFPLQTHIFFWRELLAWRAAGNEVLLLSTRRAGTGQCAHSFAASAIRETHYIHPPCVTRALWWMVRHPLRTTNAIAYVIRLRESSLAQRLRVFAILPGAADMADYAASMRVDHIHGHSCADAAHVLAMCRIMGGPTYSLTLHGDLPVYGRDHGSKMRRATIVSTDGAYLKRQIIDEVGYPEDRILATCMGVDISKFTPGENRQFIPRRLNLVTVARLDACKGHNHALAAVRTAVDHGYDIHYSLAGAGTYRAEIESKIKRLGLCDRVRLLGTLGETAVLDLLRHADAFVLPSVGIGEAYPISVMEAMSCGLPAIVSVIGATPDMITNGENGFLVQQRDEAALAEAIIQLASDVTMRRRMGDAARRRAEDGFDVRVTSARLLAEIERWRGKNSEVMTDSRE